MKLAVLNGSPRKKDSYRIIKEIEQELGMQGRVELDWIDLNKMSIKPCVGCMLCFNKGEQYCPVRDDLDEVKQRLAAADALIFTSPVYAMQVSGMFKLAVDRLSYMFHRPVLIGKPTITLSTTAGGGLKPTQSYLKMVAVGWGCQLIGQLSINATRYFNKDAGRHGKYINNCKKKIKSMSKRLQGSYESQSLPVPSWYALMMFHGLKSKTLTSSADYDYWEEKGWLGSDYYYPTKLGPIKKVIGKIIDVFIAQMYKQL